MDSLVVGDRLGEQNNKMRLLLNEGIAISVTIIEMVKMI